MIATLLFGLAGLLIGGVIQLVKSGATRFSVGVTAVLALLATAGGFAWWPSGEA
ncbi:hypothetical protein [Actinoplanes derwentensis]|uniref:Uncharacterized protein n=1 Tax=Actinoplanes derwentensis TaxID=113562 RepID=A0A1H2BYK7_9ACTN|nr:hypothetical protein [Actinoplanes derwentensis]GID84596.1 hypothetical protein Ade03nite_35200 [Actinoplanes derwentensis]SDT63348.1 hypothetical protein SAMN04489716_5033 [Actinoplanes derwentensis]